MDNVCILEMRVHHSDLEFISQITLLKLVKIIHTFRLLKPFLIQETTEACTEEQLCYPLVEIDTFLCELARTVCGVLKRLVLYHLHTLASIALLVAVFADHVQLPNPVLETKDTIQLQLQPEL